MHKDDLKHFRKGIKDAVHGVRVREAQLNEGSDGRLEEGMRICATKLNTLADEMNVITGQMDSNKTQRESALRRTIPYRVCVKSTAIVRFRLWQSAKWRGGKYGLVLPCQS
ncbi:hypothetical protein G6S35_003090 [Salmonella enterica]|nr:hypothetical protein [Salmonella enterica]